MIIRTTVEQVQQKQYDAIVIGSGMGGMACAAALAKSDHKVLVIEQHYIPGGMTHTFKRKGFQWDVGVHAIGELEEKRIPGKVLNWLTDGQLKWNQFGDGKDKVYDTFNFPDESFGLPSSGKVFNQKLKERFPEEAESIDRYFQLIYEVSSSGKAYFFLKTQHKLLHKLLNPIINRKFQKWSKKTLKEVHDEYFKDEKLKAILAGQWGYHGQAPSEASFYIHAGVIRHFWNGAYYPIGSSSTIAKAFVKSITDRGGDFIVRQRVEDIIVQKGTVKGVKLANGVNLYAPKVISAASAKTSIKQFLKGKVKDESYGAGILKLKPSPCHICLYIGFEGDINETEATESNQWLYQTWDHEKMIWDVEDQESEAPCLYVSFPTKKDPEPHGNESNKHTAEVVTFVPWQAFEQWKDTKIRKRGDDYEAFKQSMQDRVIIQMKKNFPKLLEKMTYCELSTPLSTVHYCESPQGSIYGLESSVERYQDLDLRPRTPIKGFYLSGTDVATCGVVGALFGGFLTAATIDKKIMHQMKR